MRRSQSALVALAGLMLSAGAAHAGDLFPPGPNNPLAPWTRGQPGTTYNEWFFHTPSGQAEQSLSNPTGLTPGFISNPDGAHWFPPGTPGIPQWDGNGTWSLDPGAFIDFTIPNFGPSPGPKFVYLQIKFGGVLPGWDVFDPATGAHGAHYPGEPSVTPSPIAPGVSQWSDTLMFQYNPASEIVHIFNPAGQGKCYLDQVVIDTICTPTPGTAGLLVMGGLLACRRRR